MKKKEKIIYIVNNVCKIKFYIVIIYVISIFVMGLAPVLQLKVLEKIIEVITKVIQFGYTKSYLREGIIYITLEGLIFVIISMIDNVSDLVNSSLVMNIQHNTKTIIAQKMRDVDLGFFDNPDLLDMYDNCITQVDSSITEMVNLITAIATLFVGFSGYLGIVFGVNKVAIIVIILATIPMLILKIRIKRLYYEFIISNTTTNRKIDYFFSILTDKQHFNERKMYNTTKFFLEKREKEYNQYFGKYIKINIKGCIGSFFANLIGKSGAIASIIWIFYDCMKGAFDIARFTSAFYAIINIQDSFEGVFNILSTSYESFLYFDLFFEFLNYNDDKAQGEKELTFCENVEIEFSHVFFKYYGSQRYTLEDVSFKMDGTGLFVIVGDNGSGKSTILKLLLRIYEPENGNIFINKVNISQYKQSEIIKFFSVMFQDYCKYSLSLQENIAIGDVEKKKSFDMMIREDKFCDVKKIAQNLHKGFDTELTKLFDKEGVELSIGQWQRVAIARSEFRNANVLVMDEPFASVDVDSKFEILQLIQKKKNEKMVIIVSHDLDIVNDAKKILVFADGKLLAIGSHGELLENCEYYSRLYKKHLGNRI